MKTVLWLVAVLCCFNLQAQSYERNKAVPVEQVLFGEIISVRYITETELIEDRNNGWKTFGGALIGGVIGNQFGDGSGQVAATILGAIIGGSATSDRNPRYQEKTMKLVELMIETESGEAFMVIQDYDPRMVFNKQDGVRLIYLANKTVRVDKQF